MSVTMASKPAGATQAGFAFFGAAWCIRSGNDEPGAARLRQRWRAMGLAQPFGIVQGVPTPAEPRIGVLATHRRLVEAAQADGTEAILVFDEQAMWHERAAALLAEATAELARQEWAVCVLGGHALLPLPLLPGCRALARAAHGTGLHAMAYHRRCFTRLLEDWPADVALLADHVKAKHGLDAYVAGLARAFAVQPPVACLPDLLPFQPPHLQHAYTA